MEGLIHAGAFFFQNFTVFHLLKYGGVLQHWRLIIINQCIRIKRLVGAT